MRIALICLGICAFSSVAKSAVHRIEPFSGRVQESWEAFAPYRSQEDPTYDSFLPDLAPIFAGNAVISHPKIGVYQINSGASYGLGSSGMAQAADGSKGAGLASTGPQVLPRYVEPASIIFATPLKAFGGYWGAATDYLFDPEIIEFQFYDSGGNLVGVDERSYTRSFLIDEPNRVYFGDGELLWAGWQFNVPVQRIIFGGGFIVTDFLQANMVPEPASAWLLLAASIGFILYAGRGRPFRPRTREGAA